MGTAAPLIGAYTLLIVSPGPDFLAVFKASASRSRITGLYVAAGIVTGITAWALTGLLGAATLIDHCRWLYITVRTVGGLFLVYLGVCTTLAARRAEQPGKAEGIGTTPRTRGGREPGRAVQSWRLGLATNLTNPKQMTFFGAVFATLVPQVNLGHKTVLFVVMLAIAAGWYGVVAVLASQPVVTRGYQRVRRGVDMTMGLLFVCIGGALISGCA
ncbi:LysE family transporter [Streptomyces sp. NPDC048191]|uniref:LysE family translocator n=1 Tax=Streptomyces sp. NPDC048191 TaxID=3155484 RepID=UPI0033ED450E